MTLTPDVGPEPGHDRRTFLRRAGLTGTALAFGSGVSRPAAAADADLAPFLHGVASGDPQSDRLILWTRVSPRGAGPTTVQWRIARDVRMRDVVTGGTVRTDAGKDYTVKVDATGLRPDTWYFFQFETLGRKSLVGRTRTAAVGSVDHLRFGVVSCSNYQGGYFNAYARVADRDDLAAVIHLGDYLYEYGNGDDRYGPGAGELPDGSRDHQPATEMLTLADYRLRHGGYKLDPDLRRLHQLYPFITIWDDHESTNNSRAGSAENHEPDEPDYPAEAGLDWKTRKLWAQRAYSEWMPIRTTDPSVIYRSFKYGDLLDLVMLDTRLEGRDPEIGTVLNTVTTPEIDDPNRKMISEKQRAWLYASLESSQKRGAAWRVIGQQVIMGQWYLGGAPSVPALVGPDKPVFVIKDGGNAINPDQWDGYSAERSRLFSLIRDKGFDNVVVLTGDVHTSWALDLVEDPLNPAVYNPVTGGGALGVEFVTPSITSANFESLGAAGALLWEAQLLANNPHVKFHDSTSHGYFVMDVTKERIQADWYAVPTVLEIADGEELIASWKTDTKSAHVTPAAAPAPEAAPAPGRPSADPERSEARAVTLPAAAPISGGVLAATGLSAPVAALALGTAAVVAARTRKVAAPAD